MSPSACDRACNCPLADIPDAPCICALAKIGRKIAAVGFLALALTGIAAADSTFDDVSADDIIGDAIERRECMRYETWLTPAQLPAAREAIRRERALAHPPI